MAGLKMIRGCGEGDVPRVNVIVVPGIAGTNLDDRTCPHFRDWLDRLIGDCKTRAQSWGYHHHVEIEKLESWDMYSSTGLDLLGHFRSMQRDLRFGKDDTLILIGHKMGCYILKKALVEAFQKEHREEEKQLLDMIETIVMIGEPNLHPDNQSDWIDLIAKCVSINRPLPKKLTRDLSVGVLQRISNDFEDVLLYSTLFEVSGAVRSKPKHRWKIKRAQHDGCICSATINVREFTTASADVTLEKGQGDDKVCTFHPQSGHYKNLLVLTAPHDSSQISDGHTQSGLATNDFLNVAENHATDRALMETNGQWQREAHIGLNSTPQIIVKSDSMDQTHHSPKLESSRHASDWSVDDSTDACLNVGTDSTISPTDSATSISGIQVDYPPVPDAKQGRVRKLVFSSAVPCRDRYFSGRDPTLTLLWNALPKVCPASEIREIQKKHSTILCLTGAPGIGKTAIAVEHLYRSVDRVDHVLWLNASSQSNLGRYCHDFAVALGLVEGRISQDHEKSRAKVMKWLENSGKTFLLIFDDWSRGNELTPYIPRCRNGSIVITSRYELPDDLDGIPVQTIQVSPLSNIEAARFLYHTAFRGKECEQARALVLAANRYHTSPLTLRILANSSTRHKLLISDIISRLGAKHLSLGPRNPGVDLVLSEVNGLETAELALFDCICFLDPENIPKRILLGAQRVKDLPLELFPRSSEVLTDIMIKLWSSSLIEIDRPQERCSTHRVIQDAAKATMDYETWNRSIQTATILVQAQWPSQRKLRNIMNGYWPEFDSLHSHVHSLARSCDDTRHNLRDPDDILKRLLVNSAWYNSCRGNKAEDRDLIHLAYTLFSTSNNGDTRQAATRPLPRRCLYVGVDAGISSPHLVDTDDIHAPYVALSHSWTSATAENKSMKLTGENMESFKRGIDVSYMPITFRDAISVTRNLGISYLWIDSLCIRQDNETDLAEESMHIADYYANSVLIIAESRAQTSLRRVTDHNDVLDVAQYSMYTMPRLSLADLPNPHDRGWVIQEGILSRTMNVKSSNVFEIDCIPPKSGEAFNKSLFTVNFSQNQLDALLRPTNIEEELIESKEPSLKGAEIVSQIIDDETKSLETLLAAAPTQVSPVHEAQLAFKKGEALMFQSSYIEATAALILSRDLLDVFHTAHQAFLDLYALVTSMLGIAYHLLNFDKLALDILYAGHDIYLQLTSSSTIHEHYNGRMLHAMGVCLFNLGKVDESIGRLNEARQRLARTDGEQNEWSACIDIKLADCYTYAGRSTEARVLLQSALNYFQIFTSVTAQRHIARILFRQSCTYDAEENRIMHSAFTAAARDALTSVMEASETTALGEKSSLDAVPLNQKLFDDLVEPWYR